MSLSRQDVTKIAKLSRIQLDEAEAAAMQKDLSGILGFVEQLSAVDTSSMAMVASVAPHMLPLRDDLVTSGNMADAVIRNAPISAHDCFVVPKVISND